MFKETVGRWFVRRMSEGESVASFNCGDKYQDLNDFLVNDAPQYRKELLAVTYLVEDDDRSVAYFSLANDRIGIEDFDNSNLFNRFRRKRFINSQRIKHYPAVKICRLGVDQKNQHYGIGTTLMNYIKMCFLDDNKTGCRYITVDAHTDAIPFYLKNGFNFLQMYNEEIDINSDSTYLMFFDLMSLKA